MILDEIADRIENGLRKLGQVFWRSSKEPPKPRPAPAPEPPSPREEVEKLLADLAEQKARLKQAQEEREALSKRLADNQAEAALLPSQVESSLLRGKSAQAFRQSLELERLRKEIQEDQDALPRLDQAIWSLEFRIRQIERQLKTRRLPRFRKSRPAAARQPRKGAL